MWTECPRRSATQASLSQVDPMQAQSARPLYKRKILLLGSLGENLKTQENLLLQGDPDHAVEWEYENEKILQQLEKIDRNLEEILSQETALPCGEPEIALESEIFRLLADARSVQARVGALLESEREKARKEWNEVAIARQLRSHFRAPEPTLWKKKIS